MQSLFWNPHSINYLIEIIVIGLISGFFGTRLFIAIRARQDIRATLLLFISFTADLIAIVFQFLAFALPSDEVDFALPWVSPFSALGMTAFVLHAFYFGGRPLMRRACEIALITVFLAVVTFEVSVACARYAALAEGVVLYRGDWTEIPYALGYLAAPVFFTIHLADELALERGISRRAALLPALTSLLLPAKTLAPRAAAARAFFYFCLMPLVIAVVLLARSNGLISWHTEELLASWLVMLIFSGFTLLYLNYVPERSSFMAKLVGLTLIAILLFASGISWLIGSAYSEAYIDPNRLVSQTAYRFVPGSDGRYSMARTAYRFDAPRSRKLAVGHEKLDLSFDFPFFGETYRQAFASKSGMVGFESVPRWRDVMHRLGPQPAIFPAVIALTETPAPGSGVFFDGTPEVAIITWNDLVSENAKDEYYTFQLKLYPGGTIEMAFADVPEKPTYDYYQSDSAPTMTGIVPGFQGRKVSMLHLASDLPAMAGPSEGILESRYSGFRAYLDRIYEPVAFYIIIATLIVILAFPFFFRVNLIRPLEELIGGVRQIMDGKLATNIQVFYRDEIGYLASAFNDMATAQHELVETLEDKVAARTAEASDYAAKNARLEERDRLSRELHDAVSQTLFSSSLIAEKLPELFGKNPDQAMLRLAEVRQLNRDALVEMRHLLLQLRPQKLSSTTFGKLLSDVVGDIKQRYGVPVTLNLDGDAVLPSDVQLNFFRIAQESLTNAAKHTDSDMVSVYFDTVGDQALLTVTDNGGGFKPDDVAPGHLGLQIMRERMKQIGGALEIESRPGWGTKITATWIKDKDA